MNPIPKYTAYRNSKILKLAEDQACTHCGSNNGTTVAAHSNKIADGKGVGKKSDDIFVAYLCSMCHFNYDSKRKTRTFGGLLDLKFTQQDFDDAMKKTMKIWIPILLPMREK